MPRPCTTMYDHVHEKRREFRFRLRPSKTFSSAIHDNQCVIRKLKNPFRSPEPPRWPNAIDFRPLNQAIRYYIDSHIIAIIQSCCPNYIYIDKGLYKTVNYSSGHFVVHSREIGVQWGDEYSNHEQLHM